MKFRHSILILIPILIALILYRFIIAFIASHLPVAIFCLLFSSTFHSLELIFVNKSVINQHQNSISVFSPLCVLYSHSSPVLFSGDVTCPHASSRQYKRTSDIVGLTPDHPNKTSLNSKVNCNLFACLQFVRSIIKRSTIKQGRLVYSFLEVSLCKKNEI